MTDRPTAGETIRLAKAALHEAADMLGYFGCTELADKCEERATSLRLLAAALMPQEPTDD